MTNKVPIDVRIRASGYENIYFDCPVCGKENIINRLSDLGNDIPISRLEGLVCRNNKCRQQIAIIGDTVSSAKYEWFLNELYIYVARKEYRSYVLSLCQGIEAFFYQAIINNRFDRNVNYRNSNGMIDLSRYNTERSIYEETIKPYTFNRMRTEFLKTFILERDSYLPKGFKLKEDLRQSAFDKIQTTDICTLRNKVAHKHAFRPTYKEIEKYDDLIKAIYWLGMYLSVEDSTSIINERASHVF